MIEKDFWLDELIEKCQRTELRVGDECHPD